MGKWDFVHSPASSLKQALLQAPPEAQSFSDWTTEVIRQAGLTKVEVIDRSKLNPTFAYQILSQKRHATRNKLLQLAFGMGLNIEDACELLERGGTNSLSPCVPRDVAIAYCLAHGMDVEECDQELQRAGFSPLRKQ